MKKKKQKQKMSKDKTFWLGVLLAFVFGYGASELIDNKSHRRGPSIEKVQKKGLRGKGPQMERRAENRSYSPYNRRNGLGTPQGGPWVKGENPEHRGTAQLQCSNYRKWLANKKKN